MAFHLIWLDLFGKIFSDGAKLDEGTHSSHCLVVLNEIKINYNNKYYWLKKLVRTQQLTQNNLFNQARDKVIILSLEATYPANVVL